MEERIYAAIDLKSFYASVECVERGLDPLGVNLVVADASRTEKTVCLAVTPPLKQYGIGGRARLFEVVARVEQINRARLALAPYRRFRGKSYVADELEKNPALALDYITAPPRMALYMKYSTNIYGIYLKYISPDDIFPYSIDEVFIDLTPYLKTYRTSAEALVSNMLEDVYRSTGITATAGLGTNMYLAKVAMDIVAKRRPADQNGVRLAALDEKSYRRLLWSHRPLTDFWRVGKGYQQKLEKRGIYTMGDIARISVADEDLLYRLFGVNAELLIDHAWGYEPCTMAEVKAYRPASNSISTGQVLSCPYEFDKARIVTMEMCEALALDLVEKHLVSDQIVLSIGYDAQSLMAPGAPYTGEISTDFYGRSVPKHAHGTKNLPRHTSSTNEILHATMALYDEIVNKSLLIRRINLTACRVVNEEIRNKSIPKQMDIFNSIEVIQASENAENDAYEREKSIQRAMIRIKQKHGKNAILKGLSFEEGATMRERNGQIGGHKA